MINYIVYCHLSYLKLLSLVLHISKVYFKWIENSVPKFSFFLFPPKHNMQYMQCLTFNCLRYADSHILTTCLFNVLCFKVNVKKITFDIKQTIYICVYKYIYTHKFWKKTTVFVQVYSRKVLVDVDFVCVCWFVLLIFFFCIHCFIFCCFCEHNSTQKVISISLSLIALITYLSQ